MTTNAFELFYSKYRAYAIEQGVDDKELAERIFMDLIMLAFRLYATDRDTMSPECAKVMERWTYAMDWILENV